VLSFVELAIFSFDIEQFPMIGCMGQHCTVKVLIVGNVSTSSEKSVNRTKEGIEKLRDFLFIALFVFLHFHSPKFCVSCLVLFRGTFKKNDLRSSNICWLVFFIEKFVAILIEL